MAKNYYEITLSMAAICQSARLVQQLAHEGKCDNQAFNTLLESLLQTSPPSTLAVYGNQESHLKLGLETLLSVLNTQHINNKKITVELTRYTICLMSLERKLNANSQIMNKLAERIQKLKDQMAHFELAPESTINTIAGIYVDIVSPLGPRIQVTGNATILQNSLIQAKVRTALLAGLRAAVLWQQVGGNRLQLMFFRNRLLKQAKNIIAHC